MCNNPNIEKSEPNIDLPKSTTNLSAYNYYKEMATAFHNHCDLRVEERTYKRSVAASSMLDLMLDMEIRTNANRRYEGQSLGSLCTPNDFSNIDDTLLQQWISQAKELLMEIETNE